MAIVMPARNKESALDRIAQGLSVANQGIGTVAGAYGLYRNVKDAGAKDEDRQKALDLEKQEKDANSPLSQSAREQYQKATGSPLAESVSAFQIKQTLGPVANYSLEAFKSGKNKEEKLAEIAAKGAEERRNLLAQTSKQMRQNPSKYAFDQLPPENQKQIELVASKNANVSAIKNEIDSALEILNSPEVAEAQKIKAGQNLLKTLNSTQGQDAVGAEEAKRLGSFLEYKIANLTQPGSFIGRDLDQFTDQVAIKSAQMAETYAKNEDQINQLYGRSGQPRSVGVKIPSPVASRSAPSKDVVPRADAGQGNYSADDIQALQWARSNKGDPRAQEIVKRLRGRGL